MNAFGRMAANLNASNHNGAEAAVVLAA